MSSSSQHNTEKLAMTLLAIFGLIWAVLVGVAYFIGLTVEAMWGSNASLLIFLAFFFASIVLAWLAAVKLTEPKAAVVARPEQRQYR
jgi:hypothetical protein